MATLLVVVSVPLLVTLGIFGIGKIIAGGNQPIVIPKKSDEAPVRLAPSDNDDAIPEFIDEMPTAA